MRYTLLLAGVALAGCRSDRPAPPGPPAAGRATDTTAGAPASTVPRADSVMARDTAR